MLDLAQKYGNIQQENEVVNAETQPVATTELDLSQKYGGENPDVLQGSVSKNQNTYDTRFEDRPNRFVNDLNEYNQNDNKTFGDTAKLVGSALWNIPTGFVSNTAKDIGDAVTGLGGLLSKGIYYGIPYTPVSGRNVIRTFKGENPLSYYVSDAKENTEFFKNTPEYLSAMAHGIKDVYGQKNVDLVNTTDGLKLNFDVPGLLQSYYAHPLNILDVVDGVGLLGKSKTVSNIAKLGKEGDFAKTVGNTVLRPKYSTNLATRGLQGLAETKPVQNIVNALDKSPLRPAVVDTAADFLGLNPDSRLLGEQGSLARKTKLIEQANQVKNITERNEAIAENIKNLSGLSENEAKDLINAIESGNGQATGTIFDLTDKQNEIRQALKNKVEANAEAYKNMGKLSDDTINELPINQYAAIKNNKPIIELTKKEKLDALKDINKMPDEQKPFYVPHMFEDKLRSSDFFANSTKRFKPGELKQRVNGLKDENRVYDPVELANRLDAHRIKMINTENLIKEITDNFAKKFNRKKDTLLDGYVEFNPDAILRFYRGSIDLNKVTLAKLQELGNLDDALRYSIEQSIKKLPEDTKEWLAVARNNNIYQIPKTVAETLQFGKNKKGVAESILDMGTAGFKRKVLGLSPKWFINNRIGNGVMAGLKGTNLADYAKAFTISEDLLPDSFKAKSMYEAEKTIIGRTGGGNNGTFGNLSRFLGGEFIDTRDLKGMDKVKVQLANSLAVPGKVINTITDALFNFNQKFEDLERKAVYIHSVNKVGKNTAIDNLSKTMMKTTGQNIVKQNELLKYTKDNPAVLEEVMRNVDNTLGDYINMTATERRVIRKIIPFYSWLRTITRYTLSLADENPIKTNLMTKTLEATQLDNEDLPEYQKTAAKTEFTSDLTGKPLVLNYGHSNPLSTFSEFTDSPLGVVTPLLTKPAEALMSASNEYTGDYTSPSYENNYGGGYISLNPENKGEVLRNLPTGSKLGAALMNTLRTSAPGLDWVERVGIGSIDNLINNGELKPYDKLWDTAPLGYNYEDLGRKKPDGWTTSEQLLRYLMPVQKQSKPTEYKKTKRK